MAGRREGNGGGAIGHTHDRDGVDQLLDLPGARVEVRICSSPVQQDAKSLRTHILTVAPIGQRTRLRWMTSLLLSGPALMAPFSFPSRPPAVTDHR